MVEHHLEGIFDIEPGTTALTTSVLTQDVIENVEGYDDTDKEIDGQIQNVYITALTAFADQAGLMTTDEDPKYANRGMEVANMFLNTALAAAQSRANFKMHKDKISKKTNAQGAQVTNNNLIMTRSELFEMMLRSKE